MTTFKLLQPVTKVLAHNSQRNPCVVMAIIHTALNLSSSSWRLAQHTNNFKTSEQLSDK